MSTATEQRPFTAATNKMAFAQAFSRSTLASRENLRSTRGEHRRISLLHRRRSHSATAR